jgi:hypothetical protein
MAQRGTGLAGVRRPRGGYGSPIGAAVQERNQEEAEAGRREAEMRPRLVRARLAEVASPAPSLAPDGRLDAGQNKVFDAPTEDNDLPELPIQQRAVCVAQCDLQLIQINNGRVRRGTAFDPTYCLRRRGGGAGGGGVSGARCQIVPRSN